MMLPSLPDDVVSEILSWLPVKAVCRFRCLSRGFHALISSPAFLAAHKSRAEPLLLSVATSPKVGSVLQLMDTGGNVVRVIKKTSLDMINTDFDGPVCLCLTNHRVSVLDLATGSVVRTPAEVNYIPLYYNCVGCAVPSRKYKAVFVSRYDPCKVLTLEDGAKWRKVQSPPTPSVGRSVIYHGDPTTVNGVMHFLYKAVAPQVEEYVLRFDLEGEQWKACIKSPRSGDSLQEYICMANLNDAICMIQRTPIDLLHIWALTDSAEGTWIKMYTIPMDPAFSSVRPLTIMRDGRKLLFYAFNKFKATRQLQVYDPLTGTCTNLKEFGTNHLENYGLCVLHLECFVSPKNLPISTPPGMLSRLISCRWLRRRVCCLD
jgi:F-box interacting protein